MYIAFLFYVLPPVVLCFQLADNLGLLHFSQGDGDDRHIVVRRPGPGERHKPQEPKPAHEHNKHKYIPKDHADPSMSTECKIRNKAVFVKQTNTGTCDPVLQASSHSPAATPSSLTVEVDITLSASGQEDPHQVPCDRCKQPVPVENLDLHQLRCTGQPSTSKQKVKSVQPKSKTKKTKSEKTVERVDEEDFDSLIEAAMRENKSCAFVKCKQSTATLGQNCEFCSGRFCLQHHIPEVHGCGNAARSHARQMISREGVLYRGSGIPDKKTNPTKRAHLQRKLDKKLTELSGERAVKKKEKK